MDPETIQDLPPTDGISGERGQPRRFKTTCGRCKSLPGFAFAAQLTSDDISAVASWLSSQPVPGSARPATSIPLPLPTPCGSVETK